mmetsp:Transcript_7997/g.12242  ORF Transcript_7997/g.12242 Transcript_7997/m.12242 type:complete len:212 (-) Transcript_7997:744-1379(-)
MDLIAVDALGHILAFAPANDLACEKKLGTQLCSFELVSKRWKEILSSSVGGNAWKLACEQDFLGSSAQSREEYFFCLQPVAQSAARVIQRALSKHRFARRMCWSGFIGRDLINTCCICGVRCSFNRCKLRWCPFIPLSDLISLPYHMRGSEFFVCGPCGDLHPDRALSGVVLDRETYTACFHCAAISCESYNPFRFLEWENNYWNHYSFEY